VDSVSPPPARPQEKKKIWNICEVEVAVNLRPTVSRPVCLGVRHPSGTRDQFFILLEISFRQLRVCYFVAPSLTRGRVCNLLFNCFCALPEQSLLGRSPAELTAIFYCLIRDPPNLEGHVPVFISPLTGGPVIPPGTGFPSCRLLRLAGQRWRYSNPPVHGSSSVGVRLALHRQPYKEMRPECSARCPEWRIGFPSHVK
jgi:hypothetical protein